VRGESDVAIIVNVKAVNITNTGATITWDTDRGATSKVVYGPTTSYGNSTSEDSNLVTSHSVNLTGLTPGTEYHYRVVCKEIQNKESMSGDYKFTTPGEGGVGGVDVKTYPNPYSSSKGNSMTFSIGGTAGGEVRIYTVSGKLIKKLPIPAGENDAIWDVLNEEGNDITTGLYIYSIIDGEGNKKTGKIAITN
jgi:hypothetical protein